MARKASKSQQQVQPEDESQDVPEAEEHRGKPGAPGSSSGATISEAEAAYRALDAGYEKPLEAVEYIRKTFRIEMNPQHFSSIKSNRKKQSGQEQERRGPKRKPGATSRTPEEHTKRASAGDTDLIDDMAAVKNLLQNLGAVKVRKIVGLFE